MLAGARLGMNLPPVDDGITCSETVREGQVREREREREGGGEEMCAYPIRSAVSTAFSSSERIGRVR
jgi:hypothetical protein